MIDNLIRMLGRKTNVGLCAFTILIEILVFVNIKCTSIETGEVTLEVRMHYQAGCRRESR